MKFTVFATEASPVVMAMIPIVKVCKIAGLENVTSLIPLGAADERKK